MLVSIIVVSSGNGSAIPNDQNVWISHGFYSIIFLSYNYKSYFYSISNEIWFALAVERHTVFVMSTSLHQVSEIP